MTILNATYLVTIRIDTELARNFPEGFRDPALNHGENGYNRNSYPNWDVNFLGIETEFIRTMLADFNALFAYDGLSCQIAEVRDDK
jgi:hypothetical protein